MRNKTEEERKSACNFAISFFVHLVFPAFFVHSAAAQCRFMLLLATCDGHGEKAASEKIIRKLFFNTKFITSDAEIKTCRDEKEKLSLIWLKIIRKNKEWRNGTTTDRANERINEKFMLHRCSLNVALRERKGIKMKQKTFINYFCIFHQLLYNYLK